MSQGNASLPVLQRIGGLDLGDRMDRLLDVSQAQAVAETRRLASDAGILAGMSSGGALAAALHVCSELESGTIVFIVCDRGDRYLSSDIFDSQQSGGSHRK